MIERVAGPGDPRLAGYARVGDPAWLRDHDLFVAEGRLVVSRLLEDQRIVIDSILVTPAAAAALEATLATAPCRVYVCAQDQLDALSGIHFHRGCLALARRPALPPLSSFSDARLLVGLERVADPDNVGATFRNALALGADGVLLDPGSADPLYRKAIRTSMAAVLRMPFARVDPWPSGLQPLRDAGFTVLAFTPSETATTLAEVAAAPPDRMILLFGSEGGGLSPESLEAASARVRIPVNPRSDSLNVAVAIGIALSVLGQVSSR